MVSTETGALFLSLGFGSILIIFLLYKFIKKQQQSTGEEYEDGESEKYIRLDMYHNLCCPNDESELEKESL